MLLSIELTNGRIVDLGDLGRFRATLRSKSCDKPENFKREMIHGNRVIFVPGKQIRVKMTNANYLKFDPSGVSAEEKPTPTPGNGTNGGSGSQTPTPGNETGGGSNPDEDQTGM